MIILSSILQYCGVFGNKIRSENNEIIHMGVFPRRHSAPRDRTRGAESTTLSIGRGFPSVGTS